MLRKLFVCCFIGLVSFGLFALPGCSKSNDSGQKVKAPEEEPSAEVMTLDDSERDE